MKSSEKNGKPWIVWCEQCRVEGRRWLLMTDCPHWPWEGGTMRENLSALVERLR